MNNCNNCPHKCNVDRVNKLGKCGVNKNIKIAKYYLHPYEEPIISKNNSSGTIFFTGCNLKCVFCQNYEISRENKGEEITPLKLSEIFKELESLGADNISLVTPTHYITEIIKAFEIYKPKIPVVYNSSGYEDIEKLKLIDKYIDIYLPDLKFKDNALSKRYTNSNNYFEIASEVIKFMMQSKKTKIVNDVMVSGVLVRHLVLPLLTSDSVALVEWFSKNATNNAYLSLMAQYTPIKAFKTLTELNRPITKKEYNKVLNAVFDLNVKNCIMQELTSTGKKFIPKF